MKGQKRYFDKRTFYVTLGKGALAELAIVILFCIAVYLSSLQMPPWAVSAGVVLENVIMPIVAIVLIGGAVLSPVIIAWGNARQKTSGGDSRLGLYNPKD